MKTSHDLADEIAWIETYGISNIINKDIVFIILELIRFYLYIKNKGEYGDLIYKSNKNRYHGN